MTCRAYDRKSDNKNIVFELPEPTYIEYVHANGPGHEGGGAGFSSNYNNFNRRHSCGNGYSNRYWYAVQVYLGDDATNTANESIGYISHDVFLNHATDNSSFDYKDLIKVGGSIKVPDHIGKVNYVVLKHDTDAIRWYFCNFGIFTCYCSNFRATRSEDDYETDVIELKSGTNIETQQLSVQFSIMFPEITGSCSTCTIYLQLSTSDDTVITLSDVGPFEYDTDDTEELVTTISVAEDTLSSNHTITMSTYGERDGAEYTLLLEESFTVSIENIEAVIEEVIVVEEVVEEIVEEVVVEEDFQIDIDAILAEFLE